MRLFQKEKVNHILHFFISLFTVGFWVFVWLFLIINNASKAYRCTQCGQKDRILG